MNNGRDGVLRGGTEGHQSSVSSHHRRRHCRRRYRHRQGTHGLTDTLPQWVK